MLALFCQGHAQRTYGTEDNRVFFFSSFKFGNVASVNMSSCKDLEREAIQRHLETQVHEMSNDVASMTDLTKIE